MDLETHYGEPPGLILASITLKYDSASEIARLRQSTPAIGVVAETDHVDPGATGPAGDYYAAIAFSESTWNFGSAYRYGSREEAEKAAVGYCGASDARPVISTHNGWCALAFGLLHSAWGTGSGETAEEATTVALAVAGQYTSASCRIVASVSAFGPDASDTVAPPRAPEAGRQLRFGMTGQRTNRSAQMGGVEVVMVVPESPATRIRSHGDGKSYYLVPGRDVITRINGETVTTNPELVDAVRRSPTHMTIRVYDTQTGSIEDYDVTLRD